MNNTDKAKYDAAKRMLKGKIDINEVAMMFDIPMEQLKQMKDELDEEMKSVYGATTAYDMDSGEVLFDDFNDMGLDTDISDVED